MPSSQCAHQEICAGPIQMAKSAEIARASRAVANHPTRIVPFGFVDLDAPDVAQQVEELHTLNYRGLGELEFVKKPYTDPA